MLCPMFMERFKVASLTLADLGPNAVGKYQCVEIWQLRGTVAIDSDVKRVWMCSAAGRLTESSVQRSLKLRIRNQAWT